MPRGTDIDTLDDLLTRFEAACIRAHDPTTTYNERREDNADRYDLRAQIIVHYANAWDGGQ